MGKVTKKVWLILIIVALALPMFVGCKPEPEVPDYKALLLNELKTEVAATSVATITGTWENLTVTFTKDDLPTIRTAAEGLVTTFGGKVSTTSKLVLGGQDFILDSTLDLTAVKNKVIELADSDFNGTFAYEVHVKNYKGQDFSLSGDVEIKGFDS
jgi:hypothetical protein